MALSAAGLVARRHALSALLPIRRRRVVLARLQVRHCQGELDRAQAVLAQRLAGAQRLADALSARHERLGRIVADGTRASRAQAMLAQIEWLQADRRAADKLETQARQARDEAGARLDLARRHVLILDERSRHLQKLLGQARRLADRRQAERIDARSGDRHAAERHAEARRRQQD